MFAPRYFAPRFFAPRYFPPGAEAEPQINYGAFSYVLIGPKKKRKRVKEKIEHVYDTIERSIAELEAKPQKKPVTRKIEALKQVQLRLEDVQAISQAMSEDILDETFDALDTLSRRLTQAEIKRLNAKLLALKRRADAYLLLIMAAIDG